MTTLEQLESLARRHVDADQLAADLAAHRTQLILTAKKEGHQPADIIRAARISRARYYQLTQGDDRA